MSTLGLFRLAREQLDTFPAPQERKRTRRVAGGRIRLKEEVSSLSSVTIFGHMHVGVRRDGGQTKASTNQKNS